MIFHSSVALLSGGLDSTVTLAQALKDSEKVHVLSFSYGQRHSVELSAARRIVQSYHDKDARAGRTKRCVFYEQEINLRQWGGSALTDAGIDVPQHKSHREISTTEIPVTYVPARNTVFLGFALSLAEAVGADAVYIGVNALDYSGYPDCRPDFINAMRSVYLYGTKRGIDGEPIQILTPLINLTKVQIIKLGVGLQAPMRYTWSCYDPQRQPGGRMLPCQKCDSCLLRAQGFREAVMDDPAMQEVFPLKVE